MFPEKAVKIWREANEEERVLLVQDFFKESENFEKPELFISKGKPRPSDDQYTHLGIASDPIYAVFADKVGGDPYSKKKENQHVSRKSQAQSGRVKRNRKGCQEYPLLPLCGEKMKKWAVPDNPFSQTWDNDFMYICFNDACPYFVRGWGRLAGKCKKAFPIASCTTPSGIIACPFPCRRILPLKCGVKMQK